MQTLERPPSTTAPRADRAAVSGIVTLTTDFGTRDSYVGAIKGALLTVAPDLTLVDLSHEVPPQDILAGAFLLRHAATEFPAGTVHLGVVDPGVGSARLAIVVQAGGHLWVGPDNGLFSLILAADPGARVYALTHPDLRRPSVSATFHGRDVFAPAAARLATGFPAASAGPAVPSPVRLAAIAATRRDAGLEGSVIHVDHYGNLISCITAGEVADLGDRARLQVQVGDRGLDGVVDTYADVAPGALAALIGSGGLLEIGLREGSAAAALGLGRGAPLFVAPAAARTPGRIS